MKTLIFLLALSACSPRLADRRAEHATPSRLGLEHAAYVQRLEDSLYCKTARAALVEWEKGAKK